MIVSQQIVAKNYRNDTKKKKKNTANSRDSGGVMVKTMGLESEQLSFYLAFLPIKIHILLKKFFLSFSLFSHNISSSWLYSDT